MRNRLSIKMVKDETRTIIVVDGATVEQDMAAFELIERECGYNGISACSLADEEQVIPTSESNDVNGDYEFNPESPSEEYHESDFDTGLEHKFEPDDTPAYSPGPELSTDPEIISDKSETLVAVELPPQTDTDSSVIPMTEAITESHVEMHESCCIISGGIYKGKTATQALKEDREAALVDFFLYSKNLPDGNEKEDIICRCKRFMYELPANRHLYPTRESKITFLRNVEKIMNITPFISGYSSFHGFLYFSKDTEVESVFINVTNALQKRALQNTSVTH